MASGTAIAVATTTALASSALDLTVIRRLRPRRKTASAGSAAGNCAASASADKPCRKRSSTSITVNLLRDFSKRESQLGERFVCLALDRAHRATEDLGHRHLRQVIEVAQHNDRPLTRRQVRQCRRQPLSLIDGGRCVALLRRPV